MLFIGPPRLGKRHLAQAIGQHAIKAGFLVLYRSIFDLARELQAERSPAEMDRALDRYLKPGLLIIDDIGLKTLPPKAGEALLEVILRRYENRSTLMTSNRPLEEWGKLLNDAPAAMAVLDRFLHPFIPFETLLSFAVFELFAFRFPSPQSCSPVILRNVALRPSSPAVQTSAPPPPQSSP